MGIQGLIPLLKSIHNHTHISEFSGQTLAIDAYVWLHKGAFACAPQLVKGEPTVKYVEYAMHRVRLLLHHKITPYVVFDGGPLPAKKGTESSRKQKRDENLARATELAAQGKHSEARDYYTKCVDVTPEMAFQLIKALRAERVLYVVAPYEADAQLAFLESRGIVDGVITEDSDLLVFGCKNVMFKLDSDGNCVHVKRTEFGRVKEFSFVGWGDREFREMAMLSGCDYLPSIPGLGLRTAHKLLRKYKTVTKVLQAIRMAGQLKIPLNYLENFRIAELAFLYQRVYDPFEKKLVTLNEPPEVVQWDDSYIGCDLDPKIAKRLAEGDVNPNSLLDMEDINPAFKPRPNQTVRLPLTTKSANQQPNSTITKYFTIRAPIKVPPKHVEPVASGSGKRTLSEEMGNARERPDEVQTKPMGTSRFFGNSANKRKREDEEEVVDEWLETPQKERMPRRMRMSPNGKENEEPIVQEEGYRSPSGSCYLSSPPEPSKRWEDDSADDLSSPVSVKKVPLRPLVWSTPRQSQSAPRTNGATILVAETPPGTQNNPGVSKWDVDLSDSFDDAVSDVFGFEEMAGIEELVADDEGEMVDEDGPETPEEDRIDINPDLKRELSGTPLEEGYDKLEKIAKGWRAAWGYDTGVFEPNSEPSQRPAKVIERPVESKTSFTSFHRVALCSSLQEINQSPTRKSVVTPGTSIKRPSSVRQHRNGALGNRRASDPVINDSAAAAERLKAFRYQP